MTRTEFLETLSTIWELYFSKQITMMERDRRRKTLIDQNRHLLK